MAVRVRAIALAILLTTMSVVGALAHAPNDDAGSGHDAPDDRADAMNVRPGSFMGNLTPGSYEGDLDDYDSYEDDNITRDHDWFRVNTSEDAQEPSCTRADYDLDNNPNNETRVHLEQPALHEAAINTTATGGETLAMVGPSSSGAHVGLSGLNPPRITGYEVAVDVLTLTDIEEEGGNGNEADEIPGPCFGDTLEDLEVQEWTFEAEEGQLLWVSFGTELARADDLVLEDPNGTDVGAITSDDDIAIGAAVIDETGNWTLSAEAGDSSLLDLSTTTSTYVVGFSLVDMQDPGEEEEEEGPCSPHCMS